MKELICLIGPSGAGKSTAGRILEKSFGYTCISASTNLKELKKNIENVTKYSYDLNELIASVSAVLPNGFNEYAEHVLVNSKVDRIVWDSCININHLDIVLQHFDKVYFLCFNAAFDQRIKRICQRGSFNEASSTSVKQEVFRIDQYERALGLGDLMLFADWYITADCYDELERKLSQFISQCSPTSVDEKIRYCNERFCLPSPESLTTKPLLQYLELQGEQL